MIHIIKKTIKVHHSSAQLEMLSANNDLYTISFCRDHRHFTLYKRQNEKTLNNCCLIARATNWWTKKLSWPYWRMLSFNWK